MKTSDVLKTAIKSALFASALVATVPAAYAIEQTWKPDTDYKITILHTNDNHGRFWKNKYGEYGMAARKALVDKLRAQAKANGSEVLLLSGGDINTGVPESDLQDAEPDFKGMNAIGYDAMALGNHEFDNPLSVLDKQYNWADFAMLSANIYDRKTGKRKFPAYKIFDKNNLRIAVIGLTTEDTQKIVNPENVSELEFRDPKAEAKKLIAELEKTEKPDMILAVTHMGHYANGNRGVNAPGDVALARYLAPNSLDLIIGGHSQDPVCMAADNKIDENFKPGDACKPDLQNGTWIMQAHEWGKYVGKAELTFRNGDVHLDSYELIPVNITKKVMIDGVEKRVYIQPEIKPDAKLEQFLKTYQDKGQAQLNISIGETNGKLDGDRDQVRFKQTNLGRMLAASQMERAKADFGIMNSGGVRASIEKGNITYKDVLTVQPFSNIVSYVDMTGKEIKEYLDAVATKPVDSGAYAQFYGIEMTVSPDGVSNVKIGGKPLVSTKTYRFSIPSFNAAGGDGYPKITQHPNYVNSGFVDAEVLKEFIEKNSPIDAAKFNPNNEIVYQ